MKQIVMLGTCAKGGISSVVQTYRACGLFDRWPIVFVATHATGSLLARLCMACRAGWRLASLLVRGEVALVHAHAAMRGSFWRKAIFLLMCRVAGCPVVFHLHGSEFQQFYEQGCGRLAKCCVRAVLARASKVLVLSSQWQAYITTIVPRAPVVRLVNFVVPAESSAGAEARANDDQRCDAGDCAGRVEDLRTGDALATESPSSQCPAAPPHDVLFLGRFGRRKGIYDLLDAMKILLQGVPDARLLCGGDGDEPGVRARVSALGIDTSVQVLGWVSGAAKQRLLRDAAVFALPSYNEGLPVSILEAMSVGLPVVSTPVGGIPDAIEDGVEGYLVAPGDVQRLSEALYRLLSDPALRRRMGDAARRKARADFSPQSVVPVLESIYAELGATPR